MLTRCPDANVQQHKRTRANSKQEINANVRTSEREKRYNFYCPIGDNNIM